jgi:hypothetical protein
MSTDTKDIPQPSDDDEDDDAYNSSGTSSSEDLLSRSSTKKRPSTILPQPPKPRSPRDRLYSRMTCFDSMPASIARRIDLALADLHDLYFPRSTSSSLTTTNTAATTTQHSTAGPPPPRWLLPLQTAMRLPKPSYEILTLMATEMFPGAAFALARAWIAGNGGGFAGGAAAAAATEMGLGGEERRFSI